MRLFAGVWPSTEASGILARLGRPDLPGVRWTTPAQWHVTLVFLGERPAGELDALAGALVAAARASATATADLGPATATFGRGILQVPVGGLGALAQAVRGATGTVIGQRDGPEDAFSGHLTLARVPRGRRVPPSLVGVPVACRWVVGEICLVRSVLAPGGARYETLCRATVGC